MRRKRSQEKRKLVLQSTHWKCCEGNVKALMRFSSSVFSDYYKA